MRLLVVALYVACVCASIGAKAQTYRKHAGLSNRPSPNYNLQPSYPMMRSGDLQEVSPRLFFGLWANAFEKRTKTHWRTRRVWVTCTASVRNRCRDRDDDDDGRDSGEPIKRKPQRRPAKSKRPVEKAEQFAITPTRINKVEVTPAAELELDRERRDAEETFEIPSAIEPVEYVQPLPFGLSQREGRQFRINKTVRRTKVRVETKTLVPACSRPSTFAQCPSDDLGLEEDDGDGGIQNLLNDDDDDESSNEVFPWVDNDEDGQDIDADDFFDDEKKKAQ